MTLVAQREVITIEGMDYRLGERIETTPESILALEALRDGARQLVAIRRIETNGELTTIPEPITLADYPTPPPTLQTYASASERQTHAMAMEAHVVAVREYTDQRCRQVPAPSVVGHVKVTESQTYFDLDQLDSPTTSIVPYDGKSTFLYRLQLAQIAE